MVSYNCTTCNYFSTDCSNYNRHIKSKRHKTKLAPIIPENSCKKTIITISNEVPTTPLSASLKLSESSYKCKYCDMNFKKKYNLTRHTSLCTEKSTINELNKIKQQLNLQTNKMKQQLSLQKNKIKEQEKQLEKSEQDKEYYKKLIANYGSGFMGTKNFNSVTYILNSYPNAPHLKAIEPNKIKQFIDIDANNIRDIISDYCNNKLVDNIIEAILFIHKKKDPSEQSIWATDSTRHNYIIKELLKDKDSYWVVDKKGIKSENYLIKPILSFIREKIIEYLDTLSKLLINPKLTSFKRDVIMDSQKYGSQLIKDIDDGMISKDIIKNLAKHIHHNKPQIEEIEDCITLSP